MSENNRRTLYPPIEPRRTGWLPVSHGHEIYWEDVGAEDGIPVVVLHGGPGGGITPELRRYFDPDKYRVILFDQRGCGKSRPFSSLEENTTWRLIEDMEALRAHFGIATWAVFGGSWGSTLSLAYAVTHPDRTQALMLRGVFFHTKAELDWLYSADGAGRFYPDVWQDLIAPIPEHERGDLIKAFHTRLSHADKAVRLEAARAWSHWEGNLLTLAGPENRPGDFDGDDFVDAFARIETHYFINGGFFDHDGWLIDQLPKIEGKPCYIVNGRYDVITPPLMAQRLHEALPGSRLEYPQDAGHAAGEAGTIDALVRATDDFASKHG